MGRMDRVNQLMKREISNMIQQDISEPGLTFVTILSVSVSPDLRNARVNYSVLGDEAQIKEAQQGLSRAKGYIRRLLGKRVRIRYIPELNFCYDRSIEYSARIEQALAEIKENKPEDQTEKETEQ